MSAVCQLEGFYDSSECGYCKHRVQSAKADRVELSDIRPTGLQGTLCVMTIYTLIPIEISSAHGSRCNWGLVANNMPSRVYDYMLNRNFRRSGQFFYWPLNCTKCCPQYAIRLQASQFNMRRSKQHRSVLNRLQRFLINEDNENSAVKPLNTRDCDNDRKSIVARALLKATEAVINDYFQLSPGFLPLSSIIKVEYLRNSDNLTSSIVPALLGNCVKHCCLPSSPASDKQQLAETIRSHLLQDESLESIGLQSIEATVTGHLNFIFQSSTISRGDEKDIREPSSQTNRTIRLVLERAEFKEDEYKVYRSYQISVHKDSEDEITRNSYKRFLCSSSLVSESPEGSETAAAWELGKDGTVGRLAQQPFPGYGTFHLRYELIESSQGDNTSTSRLIGVSVLDLIPSGLSSVYFFYDPEYQRLSLGVLSALCEIQLLNFGFQNCPKEFKYYYMGFYVHDCSKMKYKANFGPSELLCPVTFQWTQLDERVLQILAKYKYARFASETDSNALFKDRPATIDEIVQSRLELKVLISDLQRIMAGQALLFLKSLPVSIVKSIEQFVWLAGEEAASELIVIVSLGLR